MKCTYYFPILAGRIANKVPQTFFMSPFHPSNKPLAHPRIVLHSKLLHLAPQSRWKKSKTEKPKPKSKISTSMEQSPLPNLGPCQLWPHQNWQLITTAQWTHKTHRVYTLASFCLAAHSSSDAHEQAQHRSRQVLNKPWKESRRIFHCPTIVSKLLRFRHSEMIVFVGSTTFTARRWSKRNNRRNPFLARRFQFISCREAMRAFFDRSSFPFSHLNWRDILYFHNRIFFAFAFGSNIVWNRWFHQVPVLVRTRNHLLS